MSRRFPALLAAAGALAVAGCGGDDGAGSDLGSGADLTPAAAAFFVAVDTDFEGDQWRAAERLVTRFPAAQEALGELRRDLEADGLDFEQDIKPAVGPEVDIVLIDLDAKDDVVVLTQPKDEEKWREAVASGDDPGVTEELEDGWWAAAKTRKALDAFESARGDESLGENGAFDDAMGALPDERLAAAYVSGEALTQELAAEGDLEADDRASLRCLLGNARMPALAFALAAEENGVRVSGAVRAEDAEQPDESGSELVDKLPAGPLAVLSVNNLAEQARAFLRCAENADPAVSRRLGELETALGLSIDEDVLPLFEGETAVAVYPTVVTAQAAAFQEGSTASPLVTLATEVADEDRARGIADQIAALGKLSGGVRTEDVEIAGVRAKRVAFGNAEVLYAVFDGLLVATTAEEGISRMREEGDRLADDQRFADVRGAARAPDETTGFLYADVERAIDLAFSLAEGFADGVDEEARENLEPLRSLFLWGEVDGDLIGFEGFLRID